MKTLLVLLMALMSILRCAAQSIVVPYTWSIIAGPLDGTSGWAEGKNANARFNLPESIAVDSKGNLYVADVWNHVIRLIKHVGTDWVVSTFAGQPGVHGYQDSLTPGGALFDQPRGVAVDLKGNVFVADSYNHVIRIITPAGIVSTIAGNALNLDPTDGQPLGGYHDGPGLAGALFDFPTSVAVDKLGNLYVGDVNNLAVRKLTYSSSLNRWDVSTLAGSPNNASIGIYNNNGTLHNGPGPTAWFNIPWSVAVDGNGNVYVADVFDSAIRKITPDGTVSTLAGMPPTDEEVDAYYNGNAGNDYTLGIPYGNWDRGLGRFFFPGGVAADSLGNVYVADSYNNEIRKVSPDGKVTTLGGVPAFRWDALFGNVPFFQIANGGTPFPAGATKDGAGSDAQFNEPIGIAVDGDGNLYVGDTFNSAIRMGVAPRVQLVALEVTQVIQDWSNTVPLVQGKETYVRAHLQLRPTGNLQPVTVSGALLYATDALGNQLPGSPQSPINPGGSLEVHTANAASPKTRGDILQSLNFRMPSPWVSGWISLQLSWPGGLELVNTLLEGGGAVPVEFSPVAVPQIRFYDVQWTSTTGTHHQLGAGLPILANRLQCCYPIAQAQAEFNVLPIWWREPTDWGNQQAAVLTVLEQLAVARDSSLDSLGHWIYHGAIPALLGQGGRGRGLPPPNYVSAASVVSTYGDGRQTSSHEIGHNLGLWHDVDAALFITLEGEALGACEESGPINYVYPLFQPVLGRSTPMPTLGPMTAGENSLVYGLDTLTLRTTTQSPILSPEEIAPIPGDPNCYFDLMSYCRNHGPEDRWPSSVTYTNLLTQINKIYGPPAAVRKAGSRPKGGGTSQNYLLVRGLVDFDAQTAQFLPSLPVSLINPPPSPTPGTNFVLQALDAGGLPLQTVQFDLQPSFPEEPDTNHLAHFHLFLPPTPSIHTLMLSYNGAPLATLTAGSAAPNLTLTAPNGGQNFSTGVVNIAWSGSSAGGATLAYTVEYSADNGATWRTLAVDWQDQGLEVDSALLSATTEGLIRVIASDGINTATAQSPATFSVQPHPPALSINAPMDGSVLIGQQQLFLDASIIDMQDGVLNGTNVQWHSDRDGALGAGAILDFPANTLSEGNHTITVTAIDSAGLTNTALTHFLVLHYPPPQLGIQMTAPPGPSATLSWPSYYTNYVLQSSTNLVSGWATITNAPPLVTGYQQAVTVPASYRNSYFRLALQL